MYLNPSKQTYSITTIAQITGIKAQTLRTWEKRYGVLNPCRNQYNNREYTNTDIQYLERVLVLKSYGLKISEIAALSYEEMLLTIHQLHDTPKHIEEVVMNLTIHLIKQEESTFLTLFQALKEKNDFSYLCTHIVMGILRHLSVLWVTCSIKPEQVLHAKRILKRLILKEISLIQRNEHRHEQTVIAAHFVEEELDIEYFIALHSFAKNYNIIPNKKLLVEETETLVDHSKADIIFASLDNNLNSKEIMHTIESMRARYRECKLIFWTEHSTHNINVDSNVVLLSSQKELLNYIKQ